MSTVEIIEPTVRYPAPVGGYDRTPGEGVGHVLVLDRHGSLLEDVTLGEDTVYYLGGIDFDGTSVWVPVAEYRPDSKAVVYRLDPGAYLVSEAFRVPDHIGGVIRDRVSAIRAGQRLSRLTLACAAPAVQVSRDGQTLPTADRRSRQVVPSRGVDRKTQEMLAACQARPRAQRWGCFTDQDGDVAQPFLQVSR